MIFLQLHILPAKRTQKADFLEFSYFPPEILLLSGAKTISMIVKKQNPGKGNTSWTQLFVTKGSETHLMSKLLFTAAKLL